MSPEFSQVGIEQIITNFRLIERTPKSILRVVILGSNNSGFGSVKKSLDSFAVQKGLEIVIERTKVLDDLIPMIIDNWYQENGREAPKKADIVMLMPEIRYEPELSAGMPVDVYKDMSPEGKTTYDYVTEICNEYEVTLYALDKLATE